MKNNSIANMLTWFYESSSMFIGRINIIQGYNTSRKELGGISAYVNFV